MTNKSNLKTEEIAVAHSWGYSLHGGEGMAAGARGSW